MISRRRLLALTAAGLAAPSLLAAGRAQAGLLSPEEIEPIARLRLNSMHRANSPWGRVLNTWARAAEKQTQDKLQIVVINDGGEFAVDEADLIERLFKEDEQLLALSPPGLATLSDLTLPFQLGGVFADVEGLSAARRSIQGELDGALEALGLMELTWGHQGRRALLTKGVTARGPADLAGAPFWVAEGDSATLALVQEIGAVPVYGPLARVKRMLDKGEVAALVAPLLQAEQQGWLTRVDGLVDAPLGWSLGSVVCRSVVLSPLETFLREALFETAPKAGEALGRRIHELDAAAWAAAREALNAPALAEASVQLWQEANLGAKARLIEAGRLTQAQLDGLSAEEPADAPAETATGWEAG